MWGYVRICLLCADMFKRRLGAGQATSSVARRARWSEPAMYLVSRSPTFTPLSCTIWSISAIGMLAGIQEAAAEQVSEAGVVPCGVEIAHQHVQIVVMLQLGERVETTVPQTLVAGARREGVDGAEAHLAAAEIDRRGGNAA